ncbi:MAG: glycosyltransferase family A protein [Rhodospirillaceae bacterium]|nr:glycosyltransferase family A protein [Rhodospirillaceae bacterium]MDE0617276.1 glycosyltransferase family A protein [Rhodospirillaceae bacterium]
MTGPAVSVLTATYNRAHVLHRPYESLKRQAVRDFEWVVVDDGSSDETPELLHRWQSEADFPITWYRYDRNRGVNAAVNSGLKVVSGEYVCNLDSDDALLDDAMETIAYFRERTGIDSIPSAYQMAFRCVDQSGALVGQLNEDARKSFQNETVRSSFRNAAYRLGLSFDFITVSKAPVARSRELIELTNSEHCPESVTIFRLSDRYETIFVNRPVLRYFRNDGEDHLSDRARSSVMIAKQPRGNYIRALSILNGDVGYFLDRPKSFFGAGRKLMRLGLHLGRSPWRQFRDLANWRARLLWMAGMPGGCFGYLRDRLRGRTAPKADPDISAWGPAAPPVNPKLHLPPERFRS